MKFTRIQFAVTVVIVLLLFASVSGNQKKVVKEQSVISTEFVTPESSSLRTSLNFSEPRIGEEINWQVISSGGQNGGTSDNYRLSNTVGQTAIGSGSSASYGLNHGFWQDFTSGPEYICGDADGSGAVDIDDVVYLIQYIFAGGPAPDPLASGDADCAGGIDIDDVVYLIQYIFAGGPAPCDPDGDGVPDC